MATNVNNSDIPIRWDNLTLSNVIISIKDLKEDARYDRKKKYDQKLRYDRNREALVLVPNFFLIFSHFFSFLFRIP